MRQDRMLRDIYFIALSSNGAFDSAQSPDYVGTLSGVEVPGPLFQSHYFSSMTRGYMYILKCANNSYYCGSTKDLERRLKQHQAGEGAKHTQKFAPVELVYFEEYNRIDHAFNREHLIKGWSRKKKEALIKGDLNLLPDLSVCMNHTHWKNEGASTPLSDPSSNK